MHFHSLLRDLSRALWVSSEWQEQSHDPPYELQCNQVTQSLSFRNLKLRSIRRKSRDKEAGRRESDSGNRKSKFALLELTFSESWITFFSPLIFISVHLLVTVFASALANYSRVTVGSKAEDESGHQQTNEKSVTCETSAKHQHQRDSPNSVVCVIESQLCFRSDLSHDVRIRPIWLCRQQCSDEVHNLGYNYGSSNGLLNLENHIENLFECHRRNVVATKVSRGSGCVANASWLKRQQRSTILQLVHAWYFSTHLF